MNNKLYPRLAFENMGKHKKLYLPYIISAVITVGMFYIMTSLIFNRDIDGLRGASAIKEMLPFGSVIIGIFSCIFILYTNSFLMKQRTMELGLYNILGMEKRHIVKILFFESLYSFLFGLAGGLFFGILFDKLSGLLLLKLLQFDIIIGFHVSILGVIITAVCFSAIFLAGFVFNCLRLFRSNPIELLHSKNSGEKEPKTKIISAVFGFLFLGAGYTLAIVVTNPMKAIGIYFIAVLCVIIGTYLLFLSGSIAVLKLLKKNKKFYYQKNHFNTVSGMLYRMKQNAVGLANICILSTMVLVTISATVSLYVGAEYAVENQNPTDMRISVQFYEQYSEKYIKKIESGLKELMKQNNIDICHFMTYNHDEFTAYFDGTTLDADSLPNGNDENNHAVCFLTAEGYKALSGNNAVLKDNEVLIYATGAQLGDSFRLFNKEYKVVRYLDELKNLPAYYSYMRLNIDYIVVSDEQELTEIHNKYLSTKEMTKSVNHEIIFDLSGTDEEKLEAYHNIQDFMVTTRIECDESFWYTTTSKQDQRDGFYQIYGSLFYLGIVLGSLFLMVTVMIIYYKQISEGYSDRNRFEIMQKVGMSNDEVRKAIHSQVLTVFFLPLITAFIHLAFSFPITARVLLLIQNTDVKIFAVGLVATAIVFAVIYTVVYLITARTYYNIVSRQQNN